MAIAIVTTRFTFFNPPLIAETYAHKLCPMSSSGPRGYPLVVTTGALPTGYLPTVLTLNREAPHCAARLPTWQNNPLGETVPGMQGLKRVGRDRVGTLSSSIAVLQ